jgi:hypothetical protein
MAGGLRGSIFVAKAAQEYTDATKRFVGNDEAAHTEKEQIELLQHVASTKATAVLIAGFLEPGLSLKQLRDIVAAEVKELRTWWPKDAGAVEKDALHPVVMRRCTSALALKKVTS